MQRRRAAQRCTRLHAECCPPRLAPGSSSAAPTSIGFEIEAVSRNVARVSYATSLMKKGVFISTTEHVLSAIIGVGVDNAIIELDNLELPILDGSAKPFVDMILQSRHSPAEAARKYLKIRRELEMREGNKFIGVLPVRHLFRFLRDQLPAPLIGKETFEVQLTNGSYLRHIAGARTLDRAEDEQAMRNMGLIRARPATTALC